MSKQLTIGRSGFSLPLDAVTTTIGILGIRGSGKTHTASVVAEEMLAAGLPVIVLDPLDCLWGLRTSADGKGPGYQVTVLGGEHADIPLEASSGPIVADFAVEHGVSPILSLRHFSKTDQRRFVADFCERLYRLKGKSGNQTPLHVIIDEADEVAPQRLGHGSERCFGAVDTLVRRGRSSGIGVTLISQRPAAINKDVLTQIELLVAHRVISPQDRKAIDLWIEAHPVGEQADKMAKSLASLKAGECWVWSPSWLDVFERITVRQRRTFDSSATPKIGARVVAPSGRAEVDLGALRASMAATIEKAEANDPAALRRKIAELERQLAKASTGDHRECQSREAALSHAIDALRESNIKFEKRVADIKAICDFPEKAIPSPAGSHPSNTGDSHHRDTKDWCEDHRIIPPADRLPREARLSKQIAAFVRENSNDNGSSLPRAKRSVLIALAQYPQGRNRTQIALLSGYSQTSGSFGQTLADLGRDGLIDGSKDLFTITKSGLAALGNFAPLPTGAALIEYWSNRRPRCEGMILEYVASRYPKRLDKTVVAEATAYSPTSGSFGQAIANLRALGLITAETEFTLSDEVTA